MITERGNNTHWNYFLALDEDAGKFSRYVEYATSNFSTYSIELARLLMTASSEVDVVSKLLCSKVDSSKKAENIDDYRIILVEAFPKIANFKVVIPRYGLELIPWQNWNSDRNPDWWRDYNSVKHERNANFAKANLSNALNSIAALFVLLLYYYHEEAITGYLDPIPKLFSASSDNIKGHSIESNGLRIHYWL